MYEFRKCVQRYSGNYKVQSFSCWNQFLCMAFAELTYRESLRDIESCLNSMQKKLYHMGFRGNISRSTSAYANETRDWRIYADFAQVLIQTVYVLDSTTIDLCLSLFPRAPITSWIGGNSLGIRIPSVMAKDLMLENGSKVELIEETDKIIIQPQRTPQLEELLDAINESNLHGVVKVNGPFGNEVW